MSNLNEKPYDKIADSFIAARKKAKVNDLLIKFGDLLQHGSHILDVGCGAGTPNAKYLSERGFKITGIDISAKLLEEARANVPDGKFIKADIYDYKTSEKFSGILAWDSLFHLKPEEHREVFKKLYGLLENDGCLLFTHGGSEGEITGEMFGEKFTYSSPGPTNVRSILESLGFKIIEWSIINVEAGYLMVLGQKSTPKGTNTNSASSVSAFY